MALPLEVKKRIWSCFHVLLKRVIWTSLRTYRRSLLNGGTLHHRVLRQKTILLAAEHLTEAVRPALMMYGNISEKLQGRS